MPDWLTDRLGDRLTGWLIDWQTDIPTDWLTDRTLILTLSVTLILNDWQTDNRQTQRRDTDWLNNWLTSTHRRLVVGLVLFRCAFPPRPCHPEENCLERGLKFFGGRTILNFNWQPGCIYVTAFFPTWNCREAKKKCNWFGSFTRSPKYIFFNRLSASLPSLLSFAEFGARLTRVTEWLECSHNPGARNEVIKTQHCWLTTVQNGGNDVEFWASLETHFWWENCT